MHGDSPEDFGPLCGTGCPACLRICCCNAHWCGCHGCTKSDRGFIIGFSFVIGLLVVPAMILGIAEGAAASHLHVELEGDWFGAYMNLICWKCVVDVTVGTSALITVFTTMASFLQLGLMAMIGSVRTSDKDPAKQSQADYITGKIMQVFYCRSLYPGELIENRVLRSGCCLHLSWASFR